MPLLCPWGGQGFPWRIVAMISKVKQDSLGWQSGRWRWWILGGRWGRGKWWCVTIGLCQSKMAQPHRLTDMPICMMACTIILLPPPPAELCQWWQADPGSAGQPSKQRQRHRWQSLLCRLALSSAVPPSALCPGNIQTACACTMPYDACTNLKCTCPPPCSFCLWTWEGPSSMPHPPSAWSCFQCFSCSLSSYHRLVPFLCPCLCPR